MRIEDRVPPAACRHIRIAIVVILLVGIVPVVTPPVRAAGTLYTVTTVDDIPTNAICTASCTLRQAVKASNASDPGAGNQNTIQFANGVQGTIFLVNDGLHGVLTLSQDVVLAGPTSGTGIVVDGGNAVQLFSVATGVTASIANLTAAHGAAGFGGGIANRGTLTLVNSTLTSNTATVFGGGIYSDTSGGLTITNATITGNDAVAGGGISVNGGALTITNSTISGNTARNSQGGGIFTSSGTATLTNTIVAANTDTGGGSPPDDINAGVTSGSANNLIGAGGSGGLTDGENGNIVGVTNPLLGPLGVYGSANNARTLPLLPGSPAIDAGTASGAPATDQRGVPRGGARDIGAFESQGFTLAKTGGDIQAQGIGAAFAPLVVTIASGANEPVRNGVVTFTGPDTGPGIVASPRTAVIAANGQASVIPTANSFPGGPYPVTATARGAAPALSFMLTNLLALTGGSPSSGGIGGGNSITLTGIGFGTAADTQVLIDGVAIPAVAIIRISPTAITVVAPSHAAGTVTITVRVAGTLAAGTVPYRYGPVTPLPQPLPTAPAASPVAPLPQSRPIGPPPGGPTAAPLPAPRP